MIIHNGKHLDSIRKAYKKGDSLNRISYRAFTTVNRKDLHYFRVGDTIIIPSIISANLTDYAVFPAVYPAADTIPKIIIVSNHWLSYACYEYGKLVRFAACNTGEERKATFLEDMPLIGVIYYDILRLIIIGFCHILGIFICRQVLHFINLICQEGLFPILVFANLWMMQSGYFIGGKVQR